MTGTARTTRAEPATPRRGGVGRPAASGLTLQPKLDVNPAGDRYEAEADRVAAQVMQRGATAPALPQISALVGQPGGQRAEKKGTAANADSSEDMKKKPGKPAQKMSKAPDDDKKPAKAAQKKSKAPEDDKKKTAKAAQKKSKAPEDDKKKTAKAAQKKSKMPGEEESTKPAQRDAQSGGGFTASQGTEAAINSMQRTGGAPLEAGTRGFMENRIGHDFSGVNVHDTPAAHNAADDLGAHAFTVGNDIFFARGAYRPETTAGRSLIAHELTHTVQQQGGSVQAKRIQRAGRTQAQANPTNPPADPKIFPKADDEIIDTTKKQLTVPKLKLPKIAGKWKGQTISGDTKAAKANTQTSTVDGTPPFVLHRPTERKGDTQRKMWFDNAKTSFGGPLATAIDKIERPPEKDYTKVTDNGDPTGNEVFYLRKKKGKAESTSDVLIGTAAELSQHPQMLIPNWNIAGTHRSGNSGFEVDHLHELQMGGAHSWDNLWLLHAKANRTSGSKIKSAIEEPIKDLSKAAKRDGFWVANRGGATEPSLATFKKSWSIIFKAYEENALNLSATNTELYKKEDIRDGVQLQGLKMMGDDELSDAGLKVKPGVQPTEFSIFPYATGGTRFRIKKRGSDWKLHNRTVKSFLGGFKSLAFEYAYDATMADGEEIGRIVGQPKDTQKGTVYRQHTLKLLKSSRLGYGVYIDPADLKSFPRNSSFIGLSPLVFDEFGIGEDGLFRGRGRITASPFLISGLEVPMELHGEAVTITFPLPTDKLNLGPLSVDEASLSLGFDSTGIVLGGSADVSVKDLGQGHLEAKTTRNGPRIEGDFNFDMEFLETASAKFLYDMPEDKLELTLEAAVGAGKIPGVSGGNVTVKMSKEGVDVTGTLTPTGFLSAATITVSWTKEKGLKIEANDVPIPLGNTPAIKDAKVSVGATRNPEGVWSIYGAGEANFNLPAVTGGMKLAVKDDIFTFTGTGAVAKGPAVGKLNFTATNQAVDEMGQPIEGPALDHFRTWGSGEVTVSFGKILVGTMGIELTEADEIIVTGELALPPTFELFPIKKYEKRLLTISPPLFPIWGVDIAGVGIGIFAFFDAYLDFDAFVGPGVLKDTKLGVSYNFMKPEEASIDGTATFDVPAGAGFTLDIGGGLTAKVVTAEVRGRIGLDARLGIEANAGASVNVHWDPTDGFALDAKAYANASPKFDVGANASVTASVDLLLAEPSHTWGPWRKQLGSFGPAMSVGVEFPVSWSEKNGLDLSLDNIKVTKPEFDAAAIMKDAFLALV